MKICQSLLLKGYSHNASVGNETVKSGFHLLRWSEEIGQRVYLICSMTLQSFSYKRTLTNCCLDKQINWDQRNKTWGLEDTVGEGKVTSWQT